MNKSKSIILSRPNSWYSDNRYLTIKLDLFGKCLCVLFNKYLGKNYYFQKFTPTIRTDKNRPIWQQGTERKSLAIISPTLYDENSSQIYNKTRIINMAYPRLGTSKQRQSMFTKAPLKLDEKDFLLYFGDYSFDNVEISLGHIENCRFVPNDCFKTSSTTEVNHSNLKYPFVEEFINAIFNYKVLNERPQLDDNDMLLILEEFGISKEQIPPKIKTFKIKSDKKIEEIN